MLNLNVLKSLNLVDTINSRFKTYYYTTSGCGIVNVIVKIIQP